MTSEGSEQSSPQMRRGEEFRGKRILTNSAVMTSGQVVVVLIGMVLTPITISYVGLALFGAWGVIMTAVSYITVLDPGTSGVVARFGAMAHVRGDTKEMARLTSLGSLAWIGLGILGVPLLIFVVPLFAHYIHVPHTSTQTIITFFYFGFALVIYDAVENVITGQLMAIGLVWLSTVIDIGSRLLYAVALVIGFVAGLGLWALILASFFQTTIALTATFIVAWRQSGFPYGNPFKLDRSVIRQVTRFGGWAQLTGILDTLTYSTDSVVIGSFVSVSAVGVANVASRVARQIPYFATVPEATMPAMAAAQQAGEGPKGIARMSIKTNRISFLIGAVIASLILGTAPVLLAAWLGHQYSNADIATCLAAVALLLGMLRQTAGIGIFALGRVGYGARARVVAFFVNIVVTLALVKPLGMPGVLIGTLVAVITSTTYLQIRVNQLLDLNGWNSVWSWGLPLIAATVPAILIDRIALLFLPASVQLHRGPAFLALCLLGVLNYVALFLGLRASRYLGPDDVGYLKRAVPGPVRKLVRPWMVTMFIRAPKVQTA